MQAQQFRARAREHAERVVIAQVGLDRERQVAQVVKRAYVLRLDARGFHALAVQRHVLGRVLERRA